MTAQNGSIGPPEGAVHVDAWEGPADDRFRFFRGTRRGERAAVEIVGFQFAYGRVERVAHLHADHIDLKVTDIESLVADLSAARDEIQSLEKD
ncbi:MULTISPECIES: hypothetical protein [Mycobacteriaceae]|uniref:hypothetical protein n=1 Tax=Mycobacteriaceae TaxID=1762 RepID=UPI0007EDE037|nr:hypothetical protein [Mycolicibacterium fortuitum]MCA4727022.1 hypothetical protein [Mycolicibacterium fortuitum]OBK07655.1 hypothetical protein A5637_04855 [Mycolicibacterium fortuitum]